MTPENFVYWLQGFFEIHEKDDEVKTLSPEQVVCIRNHLNLVFQHSIDTKYGERRKELQDVHDGKNAGYKGTLGWTSKDGMDFAGWYVTIEHVDLPFSLIRFDKNQECVRARFDVDKKMFIDNFPLEVRCIFDDKAKELFVNLVKLNLKIDSSKLKLQLPKSDQSTCDSHRRYTC